MPWVFDWENKELQNQPGGIDISGGSGVAGSPGSTINPSTTNSANTAAVGTPTSSGQFTDIGKYLAVNQPQAQALGDRVAGGIEQNVNQAQSQLGQTQQEFDKSLASSSPKLSGDQISNIAHIGKPQELINFASKPENVEAFKALIGGQYAGPSSAQDVGSYDTLMQSLRPIQNVEQKAQTAGGQKELIKDVYSDPTRAKAGMLSLDRSLVSQTPEAIENIQAQAAQAPQVQDRFNEWLEKASGQAQENKQAFMDTSQMARDAFLGDQGLVNQFSSELDKKAAQQRDTVTQGANVAKNLVDTSWLLSSGIYERDPGYVGNTFKFNPGKLHAAAMDPETGQIRPEFQNALRQMGLKDINELQGMLNQASIASRGSDSGWFNLGQFMNVDPKSASNITRDTVAAPYHYEQARALEALLGDEIVNPLIGSDPSKAGTASRDIVDFRYQDLLDYLANPKRTAQVTSGTSFNPLSLVR